MWWTVRDVSPMRAERRLVERRTVPDRRRVARASADRRHTPDRRRVRQMRAQLGAYSHGWLTFESDDGRRHRVAPIPPAWELLSDHELVRLLALRTFDHF